MTVRYHLTPRADEHRKDGALWLVAHHLDRHGPMGADEVARRSGVPTKLARAALELLVAEGAAVSVVDGELSTRVESSPGRGMIEP